MYIQFQSSDKNFKKLGGFISSHNPCYADNNEAKKKFFDSLYDQTVFLVGNNEKIQLLIMSAERTGKESSYLEFTALAFDFHGESNVPVKGHVSFRI